MSANGSSLSTLYIVWRLLEDRKRSFGYMDHKTLEAWELAEDCLRDNPPPREVVDGVVRGDPYPLLKAFRFIEINDDVRWVNSHMKGTIEYFKHLFENLNLYEVFVDDPRLIDHFCNFSEDEDEDEEEKRIKEEIFFTFLATSLENKDKLNEEAWIRIHYLWLLCEDESATSQSLQGVIEGDVPPKLQKLLDQKDTLDFEFLPIGFIKLLDDYKEQQTLKLADALYESFYIQLGEDEAYGWLKELYDLIAKKNNESLRVSDRQCVYSRILLFLKLYPNMFPRGEVNWSALKEFNETFVSPVSGFSATVQNSLVSVKRSFEEQKRQRNDEIQQIIARFPRADWENLPRILSDKKRNLKESCPFFPFERLEEYLNVLETLLARQREDVVLQTQVAKAEMPPSEKPHVTFLFPPQTGL